jgi:hypothetical protein
MESASGAAPIERQIAAAAPRMGEPRGVRMQAGLMKRVPH